MTSQRSPHSRNRSMGERLGRGATMESATQKDGHIVEGVTQLRGSSTSQVAGAETCLVTSGLPITTSGLILRKG